MPVFGRWEEAGEPGENPRIHGENMQTGQKQLLQIVEQFKNNVP